MDKFTTLTGVAAPLNMINVDTDLIIPKQFLKTITRSGLGKALFFEQRYDEKGNEKPDFVLNQPAFRKATILVAGDNFGCGSSREHAPWALAGFGIKCIIAPSFADIFFNNAMKNGMLPCRLPEKRVNNLLRFLLELPCAEMTVDLAAQTISGPDGVVDRFEIGASDKHSLLNGLDEIAVTLANAKSIEAYEKTMATSRPWL
jgi:3-isopropylmalate/(R)-2-methylmalate dehydratase small subunit